MKSFDICRTEHWNSACNACLSTRWRYPVFAETFFWKTAPTFPNKLHNIQSKYRFLFFAFSALHFGKLLQIMQFSPLNLLKIPKRTKNVVTFFLRHKKTLRLAFKLKLLNSHPSAPFHPPGRQQRNKRKSFHKTNKQATFLAGVNYHLEVLLLQVWLTDSFMYFRRRHAFASGLWPMALAKKKLRNLEFAKVNICLVNEEDEDLVQRYSGKSIRPRHPSICKDFIALGMLTRTMAVMMMMSSRGLNWGRCYSGVFKVSVLIHFSVG